MLTETQKEEIRTALEKAENPLIIHDDDADGLCSFLQFYKHGNKGKGVVVKSTPRVDERFLSVVTSLVPDVIFILDIAEVEQDFVDKVTAPIYWIDHHELADVKGVKYYNPKQNKAGDNTCISKLSYDIFGEHLWIAATGTIGDWQLPEDLRTIIQTQLPEYLPAHITKPEQALFESTFGKLAMIMNFCLKGDMKKVHQNIKALMQITAPEELLNQTSKQGQQIMKLVGKVYEEYTVLLKRAIAQASDDPFLIFTYEEKRISLSGELSNELLYRFPDKIIIVARRHGGEMKTSFRSGKGIIIHDLLMEAIVGIQGRVGGHAHACGGVIKEEEWNRFITQLHETYHKRH